MFLASLLVIFAISLAILCLEMGAAPCDNRFNLREQRLMDNLSLVKNSTGRQKTDQLNPTLLIAKQMSLGLPRVTGSDRAHAS